MKKILTIMTVIGMPVAVNAQTNNTVAVDENVFNAIASIFAAALVMIFISAIVKRLLDNRIKNKIIDKGLPENIISSILQTNPKEDRDSNIKWFAILTGSGIGFTITHYTLPLGFHSLAIMAFSIATGFLGYYLFASRSGK